jgi:hypothetical protein
VWLPNQESFTKKYVDGTGTVVLNQHPYEGNQGFCVSKDFAMANQITDIADLGRPDMAAKMDSDGNGKGEMWIGAPGWGSANVNQVKVCDYDLPAFIDPIRAEESVKTAPVKLATDAWARIAQIEGTLDLRRQQLAAAIEKNADKADVYRRTVESLEDAIGGIRLEAQQLGESGLWVAQGGRCSSWPSSCRPSWPTVCWRNVSPTGCRTRSSPMVCKRATSFLAAASLR